jgi:hypothetical protein
MACVQNGTGGNFERSLRAIRLMAKRQEQPVSVIHCVMGKSECAAYYRNSIDDEQATI